MKTKRIAQLCCAALVAAGIGLNVHNALADYGIGENSFSLVAVNPDTNSNSNPDSVSVGLNGEGYELHPYPCVYTYYGIPGTKVTVTTSYGVFSDTVLASGICNVPYGEGMNCPRGGGKDCEIILCPPYTATP